MRYMNWDVLLFPEGSKIPLQEFKTGCFVTQDPDSTQTQPVATQGFPATQMTVPRQVPTVACFVPNLHHGCPFRVSLHSWQPPVASRATKAMAPLEAMIFFEARVLLDGIGVAGILFNQQPPWPQVIDTVSLLDKAGNHDLLRFPPFHQEMITQSWWSAGENMGRVKVVIAEGIVHGHGISSFERTRNLVSFSFQHAPLKILEDSGIAWPNPGMWYQPAQLYSVPSPRKMEVIDSDAHGHSPCHRDKQNDTSNALAGQNLPLSSHGYIPPPGLRSHGTQLQDPYWSPTPLLPDPFVDDEKHSMDKKRAGRLSSEDQSMPDYSHSITPASSRNISSHTIGPNTTSGSPAPEESQFEELMAALSPHKDTIGGIFVPTNTRVGSKVDTPFIQSRPSTTPEVGTLSYPHGQSRSTSIATRDPSPLLNGRSSSESMQSYGIEVLAAPVRQFEIKKKPANDIKGRKEGRLSDLEHSAKIQRALSMRSYNNEQENSRDGEDNLISVSDAKRKRGSRILSTKAAVKSETNTSPSPSRKFSKIESKSEFNSDDGDDVLTSKDGRSPLVMLENV